jgi:hypothetical protein
MVPQVIAAAVEAYNRRRPEKWGPAVASAHGRNGTVNMGDIQWNWGRKFSTPEQVAAKVAAFDPRNPWKE